MRALATPVIISVLLFFSSVYSDALADDRPGDWFEALKAEASPAELHQFLYAMPKGGDLHLHTTGSAFSEWYYELAVANEQGYRYYTKVRINECPEAYTAALRSSPYLLLFQTVDQVGLAKLSDCERAEFEPLAELNAEQKERWLNSIRLDQPLEGRNEFFETHWQRLGDLVFNPYLVGDLLAYNMRAFAAEGLLYMEPQVPIFGFREPDGTPILPEAALAIFRDRMSAVKEDITVRLQVALLRFLPNAESVLETMYGFAAQQPDVVAVNMVGREDNDKGYPLRFLPTLRALRKDHHSVKLSIHAGEVDEPNGHIKDTVLLGADRIGHGLNLITDPDTLRLFRHGPYLVEINLISNLLLEYVSDYSQHPFPEYLRTGVPVALSTDDRGMWDSTLTDEFYVAVTEFNLSWAEVTTLSRNSISYSFVEAPVKTKLLAELETRLANFERRFKRQGKNWLKQFDPPRRGFICRRYQLCEEDS